MALPPTKYEFGEADFVTDPSITEMQSSVFPLLVGTPGSVQCAGTAWCIAGAGVLVTARHVIDGCNEVIAKAGGEGGLAAMWYGNPPDDENAILSIGVPITDVCAHPDPRFDFVLLTAQVPWVNGKRVRFPSLELDFSMPKVDDQIIMIGYTAFTMERPTQESVRIEQPLSLARGRVKDVHFPNRDLTQAPFPCFGTDARCDPGMSGGPALRVNDAGDAAVVGLNISEFPYNTQEEDPQHSSFVTALRSLLPMEVAMVGPEGLRMTRTLLDLGRDDYLVSSTDFGQWGLQMSEYGVAIATHPDDARVTDDPK